jgi:uncharacterized protein YdiU (UPF0061 family)
LNQPVAAERNFHSFCMALQPLLASNQDDLLQLDEIRSGFSAVMQAQMEMMWAAKLGLDTFDAALFSELETLMMQTAVDYTIFFRELSMIPDDIGPLKKSFYNNARYDADPEGMDMYWSAWLIKWKSFIGTVRTTDANTAPSRSREEVSRQMKRVNPKYSLGEWLVVPAYQQAKAGNYALVRELQGIMTQPYDEQSKDVEDKYYKLMPIEFFETGGVSYYSCSS